MHGWRTSVELSVGEEAHKVGAVAGCDVVALEVEGNVVKGGGVAVDVESLYVAADVVAVLLGRLDLAEEVLREVRGRWASWSTMTLLEAG